MAGAQQPAGRATPFASGRYTLVREIGRGGTAVVHLANDGRSGKSCAIKILTPKYAAREDLRQRFRRECESMAQIRHPAVLRVWTWGITDGSMFLVTEFAPGGSVGAWVRQHGPMAPQRAISVALQVCDGVAAAHAFGVVHRDIKPDNVLIAADGTIRVCDFGIAMVRVMHEDPLTRTGSSIGTFGFMAPEQSEHARDVDRRADVYSIAATLWYLLRGRVPPHAFQADPWENGIPGPLCPAISRATAYRRDQRHDDVVSLRAELVEVARKLPPDPDDQPPLEVAEPTDATGSDGAVASAGLAAGSPPGNAAAVSSSDEPEVTWVDPPDSTME
ncbi:MAG: serine/threonine-protein kinase [Myxococcota bacterium]